MTQPGIATALDAYAKAGILIIPVEKGQKRPARGLIDWPERASSDPEETRRMWRDHPGSNVGVVLGPLSDLIVLDVDVKSDKPGVESLVELLHEAGLTIEDLDGLSATTPSGGLHFYFQHQGSEGLKTRLGLMPGLDLLCERSYAVGAPSVVDGVGSYSWRSGATSGAIDRAAISPMPQRLVAALMGRSDERDHGRSSMRHPGRRAAPPVKAKSIRRGAEIARIESALSCVPSDQNELWVKVGLCLAFYLEEGDAFRVFDAWSSKADNYDDEKNEARWESFLFNSQGSLTIHWLFDVARRQFGWADPKSRSVVPQEVTARVSLPDASAALRSEIENAIQHAVDSDAPTSSMVYAPMGAGKTRCTADVMSERGRGIVFAARNYGLLLEFSQQLDQRGTAYVVHKGVGSACKFTSAFKTAGQPASWKSTACRGCPAKSRCEVYSLSRLIDSGGDIPLVLTVHAAVPSLPKEIQDRVVVFDELPETVNEQVMRSVDVASASRARRVDEGDRQDLQRLDGLLLAVEEQVRRRAPSGNGVDLHHADVMEMISEVITSKDIDFELFSSLCRLAEARASINREAAQSLRDGDLVMSDIAKISRFASCLNDAIQEEGGVALRLSEVNGEIQWSAMARASSPKTSIVLDGTTEFARVEVAAWTGIAPHISGVEVLPVGGSTNKQTLFKGKRFNRGRLRGDDLHIAAEFLAEQASRRASESYPGRPLEETLAVIVPKRLADYCVQQKLLPADCVGYFGRDDVGSNRFAGRPILATAGDFHESISGIEQRAVCLGLDSQRLIDDRRCARLAQAAARPRWIRHGGDHVDMHFGDLMRPGWPSDDVEVLPQPNKHREKQMEIAVLEKGLRILIRSGIPVTVQLVQALQAPYGAGLSKPIIRESLERVAGDQGLQVVDLRRSGIRGRPPKVLSMADSGVSIESQLDLAIEMIESLTDAHELALPFDEAAAVLVETYSKAVRAVA